MPTIDMFKHESNRSFVHSYATAGVARGCRANLPSHRNRCQHDALCPLYPSDVGQGIHVVRVAGFQMRAISSRNSMHVACVECGGGL